MNLFKLPKYKAKERYPYLIGRSKEVIRVHITKTAGTSLQKGLKFNPPNKKIGIKKHYFVKEILAIESKEIWDAAFTFSFVRNPWDRLYSHYRFLLRKGRVPDFCTDYETWLHYIIEERMKDPFHHCHTQVSWLSNNEGLIDLDFIGRFENLSKDTLTIAQRLGKRIRLKHVNQNSPIRHYSDVYNQDMVDYIAKHFKDDIEYFDYSFEKK